MSKISAAVLTAAIPTKIMGKMENSPTLPKKELNCNDFYLFRN
jgi:hypothetical protein